MWLLARSNGLAHVLVSFIMRLAANFFKHLGFDADGQSIAGVGSARLVAVQNITTFMSGTGGRNSEEDGKVGAGLSQPERYLQLEDAVSSQIFEDCEKAERDYLKLKTIRGGGVAVATAGGPTHPPPTGGSIHGYVTMSEYKQVQHDLSQANVGLDTQKKNNTTLKTQLATLGGGKAPFVKGQKPHQP